MANNERRRFLKGLLGALAAAGTVVLAATQAKATDLPAAPESADDIQKRADRLAQEAGTAEQEVPVNNFVNRAFRNGTVGGGFRNGGFANGGGFRNGGFANGFGGGFANGAFRNW